MLNNFNILVVGGDERYIEVIKKLSQQGANVYMTGFEDLKEDIQTIHTELASVNFNTLDAVLLPVSGTDGNGNIKLAPFSKDDLKITVDMMKQTPEHCIIYTGISNDFLDDLAWHSQRKLVCLFKRDDMAILNSIPTAEGTLEIAMRETDTIVHGARVLVIGFGRVGVTVARLFSNAGAHVSVVARKASDLARITEIGLQPIHVKDLKNKVAQQTILINTVPSLIIDEKVLSMIQQSSLIIDLASAPGGVNFDAAKEKGIKTIHALGLPGKVAPKSAGTIIADVLIDLLES